jgi:crotonobetainyl-CoA:carnitine CoA-transferase CaiB-like acyl-CoA transferase
MDVAVQARSGVMSITGNGIGGPAKPGASMADFSGGAHLATAVLSALYRREMTGHGGELHVSLLDSMMSMLSNYSVAVIDGQAEIGPMGSGHPQLVPFQAFPTSDGYVVISTGTNRLFIDLCAALGRADLAEDARYRTNVDRVANRESLVSAISHATAQRSTAEWLEMFERLQIPCAPVNTLAAAFREEQLASQGMIVPIMHPRYGLIHLVASPYTFNGQRPMVSRPPPTLGEHTDQLLVEVLGMPPRDSEDVQMRKMFD